MTLRVRVEHVKVYINRSETGVHCVLIYLTIGTAKHYDLNRSLVYKLD